MKDNLITKETDLLSLSYKEDKITDLNFLLSSYGKNYITINNKNKKYYVPLCILGKNIYNINLNINNVSEINIKLVENLINEYLKIYKEQAEVVLIGLTENLTKSLLSLKSSCEKKNIPLDVMNFASACRTINILNADKRNLISILI